MSVQQGVVGIMERHSIQATSVDGTSPVSVVIPTTEVAGPSDTWWGMLSPVTRAWMIIGGLGGVFIVARMVMGPRSEEEPAGDDEAADGEATDE